MNTKNLFSAEAQMPGMAEDQRTNSVGTFGTSRVLWTTEDIEHKVKQNTVVIFTRGTLNSPRCGLSDALMNAVEDYGRPYELVDVSKERSIIPALKAYAGSNHLPLVFIEGELVSSWETQMNLIETGDLRAQIEKAFVKR